MIRIKYTPLCQSTSVRRHITSICINLFKASVVGISIINILTFYKYYINFFLTSVSMWTIRLGER